MAIFLMAIISWLNTKQANQLTCQNY